MKGNRLAVIDMRDEYVRALLSPLDDELGLEEPGRHEYTAYEELIQLSAYKDTQVGLSGTKPSWDDSEDEYVD